MMDACVWTSVSPVQIHVYIYYVTCIYMILSRVQIQREGECGLMCEVGFKLCGAHWLPHMFSDTRGQACSSTGNIFKEKGMAERVPLLFSLCVWVVGWHCFCCSAHFVRQYLREPEAHHFAYNFCLMSHLWLSPQGWGYRSTPPFLTFICIPGVWSWVPKLMWQTLFSLNCLFRTRLKCFDTEKKSQCLNFVCAFMFQ